MYGVVGAAIVAVVVAFVASVALGVVVGVALITDSGGEPPFGGPWVINVFRDPAVPGTGAPLLRRALALAAAAGLPALGLAVTHGNTGARAVYAALGFEDRLESLSVDL